MRLVYPFLTAVVILLSTLPVLGLEPHETRGTLDAVTVYRGQALVTRLIDIPGPAGLREVIVSELPDRTIPGSVFAESADGVEVRSVRYRLRPVAQDVREEVRKLDEQITAVKDEIDANTRHREVASRRQNYISNLEKFTTETVNVEINKGVLDAAALKEMSEYVFENWENLAETELGLAREQRDLNARLELLERKRAKLTSGCARTVREAVVFIEVPNDGGGRLRLRYMVDQANWWPSYNVRTGKARDDVLVEYNAAIQQMSGESWDNVDMTLSTATPSLAAMAPTLSPLQVGLRPPPQKVQAQSTQLGGKGYAAAKNDLWQRRVQLEAGWNYTNILAENQSFASQQTLSTQMDEAGRAMRGAPLPDFDLELNGLAAELQLLDITSRGFAKAALADAGRAEEGISVIYHLAGRITLPSRSDQQSIRIASLPMTAEFYRVAAPVLTDHVYEEAALANRSELVLLAGPVTAYIDGEFVGQGQIPTVAVGEQFTLGFGIDSSLRAQRTLVDRSERIQGGNRVVGFTYALGIENFSGDAVAVRLRDRLPEPRGSEIKVTLLDTAIALSDDPVYRSTQYKKNILRWDVEVPAQASGTEAKMVEYKFELEYDKQMTIG
jgi:hypothetical protein